MGLSVNLVKISKREAVETLQTTVFETTSIGDQSLFDKILASNKT